MLRTLYPSLDRAFVDGVDAVATRVGVRGEWLMALIDFETAGTFSPSVRNPVSGATGLIQFMPATARGLGTTVDDLARMTAVEQLAVVEAYLAPYAGRMRTLEDLYMAVLWPAAIGRTLDYVLFAAPSTAYSQNRGLDLDGDGRITKAEAAELVRRRLRSSPVVTPGPSIGTDPLQTWLRQNFEFPNFSSGVFSSTSAGAGGLWWLALAGAGVAFLYYRHA